MPLALSAHTGCAHQLQSSSITKSASSGHRVYNNQQILTAITGKRKHPRGAVWQHQLDTFPAPLVLPDDAIDLDPKYPPQSFRSWLNEGVRNQVTARRNILYVAVPPEVDPNVAFVEAWCRPKVESSTVGLYPPTSDSSEFEYRRIGLWGSRMKLMSMAFSPILERSTTA